MQNTSAQRRARLLWEAACERLRNALNPPAGAPPADDRERATAVRLAREALDAIEVAMQSGSQGNDGSSPGGQPTDASPSDGHDGTSTGGT